MDSSRRRLRRSPQRPTSFREDRLRIEPLESRMAPGGLMAASIGASLAASAHARAVDDPRASHLLSGDEMKPLFASAPSSGRTESLDLATLLDRIERQAWRPIFADQHRSRPQPRSAHFATRASDPLLTSAFSAGLGLAESGQLSDIATGTLSDAGSLAAPSAGDERPHPTNDSLPSSDGAFASTPSGVGGSAPTSSASVTGDAGGAVAATSMQRSAPPPRSDGFFVPRQALFTPPTPAVELPAEPGSNSAGVPGGAQALGAAASSPQTQPDIIAAAEGSPGESCAQLPADFDRDGSVDAEDHATWEAHFGSQQVPTIAAGDADLNTAVSGLDFLLWQQYFGGSTATHPAGELPRLCPIAARDDGDWGHSEQGTWQRVEDPRGWQDDWRYTPAGAGGSVSHWTADLAPGQYELFATWPAEPGDASDAPFRIVDGNTELAIVRADQRQVPGDGEFLGQRWASLGVHDFIRGTPTVELSNAADGRVVADAVLFVPRGLFEPLAVSAQLLHDSGLSASDGLTNAPQIVGSVSGGSGGVTLSVTIDGAAAVPVAVGAKGLFTFDPAFAQDGSADGNHTLVFSAGDASGAQVGFELIFTLDTTPPALLEFELDPDFDTPPLGDAATALPAVTFLGTSEPGALVTNQLTGDVAVAGEFGQFLFADVPLALGENEAPMFAEDAAGNIRAGFAAARRIYTEALHLAESSGNVSRLEVPVALSVNQGGRRTLEFDVATAFDTTAGASSVRDTFSIYLLDAASGATLIDRGVVGESLWAVDEEGPSTAPEVPYVESLGTRIVIDTSSIHAEFGLGTLVFELINGDGDDGSSVTISNLASIRDEFTAAEFIVPSVRAAASPAGESSPDALAHPTDDVEVFTDNLWFDPIRGAYNLDLRVRNNGAVAFASDLAVVVEGLSIGAQLTTVSGFDFLGQPYVNFASVLPATGLPSGSESDRLTITIVMDDPQAVPLTPIFQPHARLPVLEIYESIRNTYDYQPYRGAMKGAQGVRETERGNAWDMSSLLVEEFRAAGIPAEYAFDRVQLPVELAANWLGAANLSGTLEILTAAGLQPAEVLVGGWVAGVEFDHAWVVANVAFPGESAWWLDFDPSIKQVERQAGIPGIVAGVPFEIDAYLAQPSSIDATEYYASQVSDYLGVHHPGASLADVPQFGEIVPRHADALPVGVLFTFDGNPLTAASIPVHETHRVLVEIRTTFFGNTTTYASRTFSLPDEGRDRITITWESGGVPFSVIPKIRLDGDLPGGGQALSTGTVVDLVIGIFNAGDLVVDTALTRKIIAGEVAAVALDANQISDEMLLDLQNVVQEASFVRRQGDLIDRETETGALLSLLGAHYFFDSYADAEFLLGLTQGRRNYNDVSVAFLAGQGLATDLEQMFIAIPETGLIDVLWQTLLVSPDGDPADDQARQQLVGVNSSDHERRVFERQLAAEGISTIRVLQAANEAGIPVFTIDASNRAILEPQLKVSAQARLQIAQELDLGYTVIAPERSVTIGDWIGTGWITDGPLDDGFKLLGNFGAGNGGAWFSRVSPLEEFCFHPLPASQKRGRNYVDVVGNLFRSATDIDLPAIGIPLEFERFYASSAQADVGLGVGWNHTWGHRLEIASDGSVVWVTPQQHGFQFLPDGSGGFVTPDLLAGTLTELADGSFSYRHKDGLTRLFDSGGLFQEVHDRFGNRVTLRYDAGRLTSVDHQTSGVSLQFSNVDDHISAVTDYAGRTWTYAYDQMTHPLSGVDYFALAQVTSPSDAATAAVVTGYRYYNDEVRAGRLAEIIDPDGLAETFQYAANGKVLSTSHPETGTLTFEYDFVGKSTTVTDARGFRWRASYDDEGQIIREDRENDLQQMVRVATYSWVAGNLAATTDALGHTTTFTYDALDNVLQTVDAMGNVVSTSYDPQFSLPQTLAEPGGRVTRFEYDAEGNRIRTTDAEVNVASATYDSFGQRISETLPRGHETGDLLTFTTTTVYNHLGEVVSRSTGLPATEFFEYDDAGNLVYAVDANGNAAEFRYDALDRLTSTVDPLGQSQTTIWDTLGRVVVQRDELGRREAHFYDRIGRQTTMLHADGSSTSSHYDPLRNTLQTTDERGHATRLAYDAWSRLVEVARPDGTIERSTWDIANRLTAQADALGHTAYFTYDPLNRLVGEVDPLAGEATYAYDPHGNLVEFGDKSGRITRLSYDKNNRLVQSTDPLGGIWQFEYDAHGNLTVATDSLNRISTAVYDAHDRTIVAANALGETTTWTYDSVGNLTSSTNQNGNTTLFAYDALDRLVSSVDPLGSATWNLYDAVGNIVAQEDALGRATNFEYDLRDRLVLSVDPQGGFEEWSYDPTGNMATYRDKRGFFTDFQYDSRNRLVSSIDPFGATFELQYDAAGNLTQQLDELGRITRYEYDPLNRLSSVTDAMGGETTTQYDPVGNVVAVTDELGRMSRFVYDDLDRVVESVDPLNGVVLSTYDLVGNLTSTTDQLGRLTQWTYDLADRPISRIDPNGGLRSLAYDAGGNVTAASDELGRVTQFQYDAREQLVGRADALGGFSTLQYDAVGNLVASRDELGRTTSFAYDGLDRLIQATDPLGSQNTYAYDQNGNLASTTDPLGHATTYLYDPLNRLIIVTDPLGQLTSFGYDAVGNLISQTDPIGRTTTLTYDILDRMTSVADPLGNTTAFNYDAVGNITRVTDPLGLQTQRTFDALNRLTSTIDPSGGAIQHSWDAVGNLTAFVDPLGNATTYEYDGLDRRVEETDALGGVREFLFDMIGNLIETTDRNGRVTRFDYDSLNRPTNEEWVEGGAVTRSFNYQYDAAHQLVAASDPVSSYSFVYDDAGRVIQNSNAGAPGVPLVEFAYDWDAADNLVATTEMIAGVITASTSRSYDSLHRPVQITQTGSDAVEKRVDLDFDAAGQLTRIDRFADLAAASIVAQTQFAYDDAGRLTELVHASGGVASASYAWTFDAASRLTQEVSIDGASNYAYDQRNQLIAADHVLQPDELYTYDANGNRALAGYQTGSDNRVLSDGTYDYQYDAEGNRTLRTEIATGEKTRYEWDHRNRLTAVRTTDGVGNLRMEALFQYDLFDHRIARSIDPDGDGPLPAETERLVYDRDHIALAFDENGQRTDRYLYGPQIDQVFAAEDAGGDLLWALTDHLGTVRDLADNRGAIVNHIVYDSFGRVVSETDSSVDLRFSYTGREFDQETDLFYYRARYYDAALGRFLSQDPIAFAAGDANLYRYVGNHSVYATDPLGLAEGPDEKKPEELKAKAILGGWIQTASQYIDQAYQAFQGPDSTLNADSSSSNLSFAPTIGPASDTPSQGGDQAVGGGGPFDSFSPTESPADNVTIFGFQSGPDGTRTALPSESQLDPDILGADRFEEVLNSRKTDTTNGKGSIPHADLGLGRILGDLGSLPGKAWEAVAKTFYPSDGSKSFAAQHPEAVDAANKLGKVAEVGMTHADFPTVPRAVPQIQGPPGKGGLAEQVQQALQNRPRTQTLPRTSPLVGPPQPNSPEPQASRRPFPNAVPIDADTDFLQVGAPLVPRSKTPVAIVSPQESGSRLVKNYLSSTSRRPLAGVQDVAVHGRKNYFVVYDQYARPRLLSPSQLKTLLIQQGVPTGTPIRLSSCSSGCDPNGAAAQFSKIWGGQVLAPTNEVNSFGAVSGGGIWVSR